MVAAALSQKCVLPSRAAVAPRAARRVGAVRVQAVKQEQKVRMCNGRKLLSRLPPSYSLPDAPAAQCCCSTLLASFETAYAAHDALRATQWQCAAPLTAALAPPPPLPRCRPPLWLLCLRLPWLLPPLPRPPRRR